jgi:hypothetical protein
LFPTALSASGSPLLRPQIRLSISFLRLLPGQRRGLAPTL